MPQRHPADSQVLQDYYHSQEFEEFKKQFFNENNMEKKQPDFYDEPFKTDGEGNELTVRDCLNRRERRQLMREKKRMAKKNRRR